jgi:NADPH-dependent 2,4-dienoyl-CoA reductase/sulfur reductase-like enzyme/nitrite reductase/ring-hydroxylating ferredoxin subunit
MSEEQAKLGGPDLTKGVPLSMIADGAMLAGHAHGEPAMLARRGDELFAIGAVCTHYGAPLAEGLLDGDTVRCQWHHACFSLRTGEALRAPALDAVSCWQVETIDGTVYVRGKRPHAGRKPGLKTSSAPASVLIVGGGAAGNAAAEMLRRDGFLGSITMLSADEALPCDRPKLSKGYLSGAADAAEVPLRSPEFYREHSIDLRLGVRVASLDTANRQVLLAEGSRHGYHALLLATGAEAVQLDVPGAQLPHVHTLRAVADSRAIVAAAATSKRAVVIGSSFIGLEVASSLRARDIAVHVVTPETCPMERILGTVAGTFIRALHEAHGVIFHLGTTATSIDARSVTLESGERLDTDLVVVGIGVRPALSLAEKAGLATDRGVTVDAFLETSVPGIFAAGDIARWPDPFSGERLRVEHWVVAERQGQTAARNILGQRERFDAVPFFWTEQYDFGLGYIGHAEHFDQAEIAGSLQARDCAITYRQAGQKVAVAIVRRDLAGLRAEIEFESVIAGKGRAVIGVSPTKP